MGSRKVRSYFLLALLFPLIGLLFQNCSPVQFQVSENFRIGNSDNGYSYGGKPSGNYFRFTPDFRCENKETPVASVQIFNTQISLVENRKLQCGAVNIQLDPNLIDSSINQRDVIGYREGIFEGQSEAPTKIPANLVELWCRDRNDEQGIETITHFDREINQAVNRTFYSTLRTDGTYNSKEISDFSVSRLVRQRKVNVKDGQNFELIVDRDKLAPEPGLFMGTLKAIIEGKTENRVMKCRLGGSLDPKVWPVKQIIDFSYSNYSIRTAPDLSRFVFPRPMGKLFISTLDGNDQKFVDAKGSNSIYSNIWDLKFSHDSKNLIYTGHAFYQFVMELFRIDLGSSVLNPMLLNKPESAARIGLNFQISADNKHVIYSGGGEVNYSGGLSGNQGWIRSVPIAGGSVKVLNPEILNRTVLSFHVPKTNNKVIFQFGSTDGTYDLYSVDSDGGNLRLIPTHLPLGYDVWVLNSLIDSPDFVSVSASKYINDQLIDSNNFAIALDGSKSIELGRGPHSGVSPSGRFVFSTPPNTSNLRVIDLKEEFFFLSDLILEPTFSHDSSALIGRRVLTNGEIQAVSVSTMDGISANLCPFLGPPVPLGVTEISQNSYVIITFDKGRNILGVYVKKPDSVCQLVNSIPVEFSNSSNHPQLSIKGFRVSRDQGKIIVNLGIQESFYYNQLFYLPLDGQPSMQVNAPILLETQINEVYFLDDSKTIVFYGNQFNSDTGANQVFRWKAP